MDEEDLYSIIDTETGETKPACNKIILKVEFKNLPKEAMERFKGRTFSYESTGPSDAGISIHYRKIYELGRDVVIELKTKKGFVKKHTKHVKRLRIL